MIGQYDRNSATDMQALRQQFHVRRMNTEYLIDARCPPLPHHGDTFDPPYDVSEYGDDDRDNEDGNGDLGEDRGYRDAADAPQLHTILTQGSTILTLNDQQKKGANDELKEKVSVLDEDAEVWTAKLVSTSRIPSLVFPLTIETQPLLLGPATVRQETSS